MRILERCLLERENWNGRSNAQFYTAVHPHTMGLLSSREGVIFISANGGDWRSKSLALLLMFSTTLDGFYFANCVLAAVASTKLDTKKKNN